jgi:hypothetical protein
MVARVNGSPLLGPGTLAPQQARRANDLGGVESNICVDGVVRAASPVAGKGLTLSHGWHAV